MRCLLFFRFSSNKMLRLLCLALLAGFAFTFLFGSHTVSAQTVRSGMADGTTCTSYCEGGALVTTNAGYLSVWGEFQVPCSSGGGVAYIWVGLGGHVDADELGNASTSGLFAGIEMTAGKAWLALDATGPDGTPIYTSSPVNCGDTIVAQVTGKQAFVEDTSLSNQPSFKMTSILAPYNQQAKCVVEANSGIPLLNFGTVTFSQQCWVDDSQAGWEAFGQTGIGYLTASGNSNDTLATDPNASRSGLTPGAPEQIQWYAAT